MTSLSLAALLWRRADPKPVVGHHHAHKRTRVVGPSVVDPLNTGLSQPRPGKQQRDFAPHPAFVPQQNQIEAQAQAQPQASSMGQAPGQSQLNSAAPGGDSATSRFLATLTCEEREMLEAEGIEVPSDGPLTKAEERELKRLRRKVKNKLSAKDSRRRRKEHMSVLEGENDLLRQKVDRLESANSSLAATLHRVYEAVRPSASTTADSSSGSSGGCQQKACVMILCALALTRSSTLRPNARRQSAHDVAHLGEMVASPEEPSVAHPSHQVGTGVKSAGLVTDVPAEELSNVLDLSREVRDSIASLLVSKGALASLGGIVTETAAESLSANTGERTGGPSLASALDVQGLVLYPGGKEGRFPELLPPQSVAELARASAADQVPALSLPLRHQGTALKRKAQSQEAA